jgi:tetratricopeptide (TPR) repeat protein
MTIDRDIDWDEDVELDADGEYRALVRSITWNEGFGLVFVRCSPVQGEDLIAKIRGEVSGKRIEVLRLTEPIDNFYQQVEKLEGRDEIEILFVTGLEKSLYAYEDTKRVAGWTSPEIYNYGWKGVPRVLVNLNQQRERLQRDFPFCFVFLVPLFVLKYLIKRAPDFFDWKSGVFQLPEARDTVQQTSLRIMAEGDYEQYRTLTEAERVQKILELRELIDEEYQKPEIKAELWREVGLVYAAGELYEQAIASYDKALVFKPDFHEAWYNRGNALDDLGRNEEAVASFDKALEFQPNFHQAWYNRGVALGNLGRNEEAVASFDKALEFQPDKHEAWNSRGAVLCDYLGRNEEAVASFDKALEFQPDFHQAWYNRGVALDDLGRTEEAVASFDKAVEFQPDFHLAWNNRGIALFNLGRYEEAVASYDKAVEFQPDFHQAWFNRGAALRRLGKSEDAVASYDKAIEINPDDDETWGRRGYALFTLKRYEDALSSYHRAIELNPKSANAWYSKACLYALQQNLDAAISHLQTAIDLDPEYRDMAKTDTDFDSIRDCDRFLALLEATPDAGDWEFGSI